MALELKRGELTYSDLAGMPDDGHRYELIDGVLLVTPAPILRHQLVLSRLHVLLSAGAPRGIDVLVSPVDVKVSEVTVVEPDILVLDRPDPAALYVSAPPLLVVEILSPSTRRIDVSAKRMVYEEFGIPSYWIVDPVAPSVLVLELGADGRYVEIVAATGDEAAEMSKPFTVTVVPSSLSARS